MASQYGGYGYQATDTHTNLLPQQQSPQPTQPQTVQSKDPQPPTYPQQQQPQHQHQTDPYGSYSSSLQQQPQTDQQQQPEQNNCDPSQWKLSKLVFINIVNIIFLSVWSGLLLAYNTTDWRTPFFVALMSGITAGCSLAYAVFLVFWLLTACCKCWDPRQLHWTGMKLYVIVTFIPALFTFFRSIIDSEDHSKFFAFCIIYNLSVSMFYMVKVQSKMDTSSTFVTSPRHLAVQCFLIQYFAPFLFLGMLVWGLIGGFICSPPSSSNTNQQQQHQQQHQQAGAYPAYQPTQYQPAQQYQQYQQYPQQSA